jgi:hypothetical protein
VKVRGRREEGDERDGILVIRVKVANFFTTLARFIEKKFAKA